MTSVSSRAAFGVVAAALVALFLWLGFWQLDRLEETRAANARHRAVMERPPVELGPGARIPPAESLYWRRVVVEGRFDYEREVVLAPRSVEGTPAVYLLTPLLVGDAGGGGADAADGGPVALPVLRGAVPAPDGFHAPAGEARPAPDATGAGHGGRAGNVLVRGLVLPPPGVETARTPDTLHTAVGVLPVLPRLDLDRVRELLPYPARPLYLQADSTTAPVPPSEGIRLPMRVAPPGLDDGAHLSYAIQWFSFAAILLVGGGIYLLLHRG